MRMLRIDSASPFHTLIGVGGIGTGCVFSLDGNQTLGRNESRAGHLLDVRDYCKLHIIIHYVSKLLGAGQSEFRVRAIGRVGDDAAGRQVVKAMNEVGIETSLVHRVAGKPTLFSVCFQYPDGCGGNITTDNSAAGTVSIADVNTATEALNTGGSRVIALAAPEVPLSARFHLLQLATHTGAFRAASFTSGEITNACGMGMFQLLDLVALNESEASEVVSVPFSTEAREIFIAACQEFIRASCPSLRMVVSTGANGAYALTSEISNYCPAPKIKVASTAGAGDALLGGVLAALAAGIELVKPRDRATSNSLETALDLGVLLASYKCLSPHTIHPGASLMSLIDFARELGLTFAPKLQGFFVEAA